MSIVISIVINNDDLIPDKISKRTFVCIKLNIKL